MRIFVIIFFLFISWQTPFLKGFVHAQSHQEELYEAAVRAFDDGFYDVSIRYLEQFLSESVQHPKIPQARFILAQSYFFKNRYADALNIFKGLEDVYDNKELLLFWLGEVYLKLADYPAAQTKYKELIVNYPQSGYLPQAYYSLGWSYFDKKQYEQARGVFEQLTLKFPKHQLSQDALLKTAQSFYDEASYRKALKSFMSYIVAYPQAENLQEVYLNLADTYYYIEDYANAKLYYEKVLRAQDPKLVMSAYVGKIWSLLKSRSFDDAQRTLKEAQEFSRLNKISEDDLMLVKANIMVEKGDLAEAVTVFDALIRDFPRGQYHLQAYLGRANVNFLLKKYQESIADYSYVADRGNDPQLAVKAGLGIAWSYAKLNDLVQARSRFQRIADQSSDPETKANALVQLADVLAEAEQIEEAISVYEDVLKDQPDHSMADYVRHQLAVVLLKAGKVQQAVLVLSDLKKDFPQSRYLEDVDYYLGLAAFKNNEWELAAERIEVFLKNLSRPSDFLPEANYILALSYMNIKQTEEALKIFQRILRLYPDHAAVAKNSDIGIAKCQFELGQVKEAVKRFKLIAYKYPKTDTAFEALLWLAQYYLKTSDYAQAIEFYQQILEGFADHANINQIRYELGQAYEIQGVYDQALAQYKQIPQQDEGLYAKVKLAIAGIFAKEFDVTKALEAYEAIASASPTLARESYLKIAQLYRNNQNYQKELEMYEKALKVDAAGGSISNAEILFAVADTYEIMGSADEAVSGYLKIPAQHPAEILWAVKAYLRVARIFEDRKDWAGAKVTYQKIIQLNTDESKFAQERLDWINSNGGTKK